MARKTLATIINRHQVYLEQVKSGLVRDFDKVHGRLDKAISEVVGALEVETLDELSKGELSVLLRDLRQAQTGVAAEALFDLSEDLRLMSGHEARFESSTLQAAIDAASSGHKLTPATAAQAYQRALDHPVAGTGKTLEPFTRTWTNSQIGMVETAVRDGWAQGKTVGQLMQQVRGTKKALYKDGIANVSRHQAAAMVRTSSQHVAQQARMATWAKNDDLVQGYSILATLDSVTSQICRSLDGEKFELGKGPVPPLHPNCRSTTLPELGPEFDFLDEGATRSSEFGYVDAKQTYYDWLKTQPRKFVDDAIGPARAKLLLEGDMTTQQFKDLNLGKNFEPRTLADMARLNPTAFENTGLFKYIPEGAFDEFQNPPGVAQPLVLQHLTTPQNAAKILGGEGFKLGGTGGVGGGALGQGIYLSPLGTELSPGTMARLSAKLEVDVGGLRFDDGIEFSNTKKEMGITGSLYGESVEIQAEFTRRMKAKGFDGIHLEGTETVVFDPSKVKSIKWVSK